MALFFTQNEIVKKIPTVKIGLEKNIQKIFEKNLDELLDITFLAFLFDPRLNKNPLNRATSSLS